MGRVSAVAMGEFFSAIAKGPGLQVAIALAYSAIPFIGYGLGSSRVGAFGKIATCAAAGAIASLFLHLENGLGHLLAYVGGFAYFAALAPAVRSARQLLERRQLTLPALAWLAAIAFVVVPAIVAPGPLYFAVQLRGWERAFAAYSYCIDAKRDRSGEALKDTLFFSWLTRVLFSQIERGWRPPRVAQAEPA